METKLNSYILPDKVKEDMRYKLYKTQQEELGFTLCSKPDNIIRPRGDLIGDPLRIEINPRACKKDEKFLGGYHTHPREDSHASAEDLRYCGIFKIICTGGKSDNKIRCNTWKYEQQSVEEHNKMIHDIRKGITKSENLKYQPNFDCIHTIDPLFSDEKYIKEKMDKDLDKIKSYLSILKKSRSAESVVTNVQNMLIVATDARNIHANRLKNEIKNESKKYYNEVEIK